MQYKNVCIQVVKEDVTIKFEVTFEDGDNIEQSTKEVIAFAKSIMSRGTVPLKNQLPSSAVADLFK